MNKSYDSLARDLEQCEKSEHLPVGVVGKIEQLTDSPLKIDLEEIKIIPKDFVMAVGDVKSDQMGTAARANGGKAAFDLMPLGQVAWLMSRDDKIWRLAEDIEGAHVIDELGKFQRGLGDAHIVLTYCTAYHVQYSADAYREHDLLKALWEVCHVWDYGRQKYAEWNWAKGAPWSVPIGCIVRHVQQTMADPMSMDTDSGFSHTAHVVCNAMMLVHYAEYWNKRSAKADNRPFQFFGHPEAPL